MGICILADAQNLGFISTFKFEKPMLGVFVSKMVLQSVVKLMHWPRKVKKNSPGNFRQAVGREQKQSMRG